MVCPYCQASAERVVKYGFFSRLTGHQARIQRFLCRECRRKFSTQTGSLTYKERKPHLTQPVLRLLMEGLSQRACARTLGCKPQTVASKIMRLGSRAKSHLAARQVGDGTTDINEKTVVFDEMETFDHSKCKPVSIAIAVEEKSRRVIGVEVAAMPAKGKLAAISRKRYGKRVDKRPQALTRLLSEVKRLYPQLALIKSDECPRYPRYVKKILGKDVKHQTFKGRRGCVVGQGELKAGGFDPLFSLNHTCAMFRDHIKRLSRRTWCTTKNIDRLGDLVSMYAWWHNQTISGSKRPFNIG
jgi:transposase-like protein